MATLTYEFTTPGLHTFDLPANAINANFILRAGKGGDALAATFVDPRNVGTPSPFVNGAQGQYMTGTLDPSTAAGTITVYLGAKGGTATSNFGFDAGASGGIGYYYGGDGGQAPGAETWVTAGGGGGGGGASALLTSDGTILCIAGGGGGAGGSAYDYGGQVPSYTTGLVTTLSGQGDGGTGGNGSTSANGGSGGGGGGNPKGNGGAMGISGNHIPGKAGGGGGGYYNALAFTACAITDEAFLPSLSDNGYFYISFDSGDPPTVQLSADPAVVLNGGSTTVSWEVTAAPGDEATSISLNGNPVAEVGTLTVSPTVSTDYTLIAIGPGGTTTDTIRIVVIEPGGGGTTVVTTTYNVVAVHRYFNATTGDHFCALANSAPLGYTDEGILCYAFDVATGQPVHTVALIDNDDGDPDGGEKPYSGIIGYVYPNLDNGLTQAVLDNLPVNVTTIYGWTNGSDTMWSGQAGGEGAYNTGAVDTDANGIIFYAPDTGYSFDTETPNPVTTFTYGTGQHEFLIPAQTTDCFITIAAGRGGSGGSDAGGGGCGGGKGRTATFEMLPSNNDRQIQLRVGSQGSNGASGSPGNKPGGSGGSVTGSGDGGAGGRDSQGGGWSGSGAGGGAATNIFDVGLNDYIATVGGGGGGGGGSWNAGCSGSGGNGGSSSDTANVNSSNGGGGSNCGGDGGGGGGGGGGHSGGGGGGAGVDKSFGGSSGGGGSSRYRSDIMTLDTESTQNGNGYAVISFVTPPTIAYFRANDDSPDTDIQEGDNVILSWSTLFNGDNTASAAEIDQGIGSVQVGEQFIITSPTVTTTYTLTVSNAGAFSQQQVTVNVIPPDNIADIFTFNIIEDAELTTLYSSNTITISGLEIATTIYATNGAEVSVNGGAFTTDTQPLNDADTVTIRMTSSAQYDTPKTTSIVAGETSTSWTIKTKTAPANVPNAFEFEDVNPAPLLSYVYSNQITVSGLNVSGAVSAPVGAPLNTAEYAVTPVSTGVELAFTDAASAISNGDKIRMRVFTSDILGDTKSTGLSVADGPIVTWNVVNVNSADSNPDYFDFTNVSGADPSVFVESNIVTITGINVPTDIEVTDGLEYRVNGGPWGTTGTINNDETLQLRIFSSSEPGESVSGTVGLGNTIVKLEDDWIVSTTSEGDINPDAFFFSNKDKQPPNTLVTSNVVLVLGITSPSPIVITAGEMKINNGPWVTSGSINNGETLQLRITSSPSLDTPVSMSITVG